MPMPMVLGHQQQPSWQPSGSRPGTAAQAHPSPAVAPDPRRSPRSRPGGDASARTRTQPALPVRLRPQDQHCCGQQRGPSEDQLARADLATLAQQAIPDLAGLSDHALEHLSEDLMDLPALDLSLLVALPKLIGPDLQRVRESIELDDADWGWDALTAVHQQICSKPSPSQSVSTAPPAASTSPPDGSICPGASGARRERTGLLWDRQARAASCRTATALSMSAPPEDDRASADVAAAAAQPACASRQAAPAHRGRRGPDQPTAMTSDGSVQLERLVRSSDVR